MGRNVKKPVRRRGAKRQAERRGGRKKKRVAFDVVTTTILIVAICVFAFSLFQLVKMLIPYYSGGKEYDKLKDKAITIETTKDSEDTSEARFKVDLMYSCRKIRILLHGSVLMNRRSLVIRL